MAAMTCQISISLSFLSIRICACDRRSQKTFIETKAFSANASLRGKKRMNENLSNVVKLDSTCENLIRSQVRNDGESVGFFSRQLEQILARTYDIKYPALKGTTVLPVDTSINTGAKTFTFRTYDSVGASKIIADYSQDLPRCDILGKETTRPLRSIGQSFGYSIQEIRAAQFGGLPLEQRRANSCRQANDQLVNRIAWSGDAEYGLYGFLNYPNVPVSDVPNDGTGGTTEWVNKTPEQILRDMNLAVTEILTNTKAVHNANTLLLPVEQYAYISRTPYSNFTATTILQFFQQNNPGIMVDWVNELKGAGTAGKDVMIAYDKNIDNQSLVIPQAFESFPPQARGLEIVIPTHSRCGGVVFYYPFSANIKEGI